MQDAINKLTGCAIRAGISHQDWPTIMIVGQMHLHRPNFILNAVSLSGLPFKYRCPLAPNGRI